MSQLRSFVESMKDAKTSPKNQCQSESADDRDASAVCNKNEGEVHLLNVQKKLSLSPGTYTAEFASGSDAIKLQTAKSKVGGNILAEKDENSGKKLEKSEGLQYQSNCGFLEYENCPISNINIPNIKMSVETCNIVYLDLETSGFQKTDEILQIAARYEEYEFSVYITPTREINPQASEHTGLKNIDGQLFFHHKKLSTIPLKEALLSLKEFLNTSEKPCIIVAHNASFDTSYLVRAILQNDMINDFQIIAGFCDSLALFKKRFPERKGGVFKLHVLAADFLSITSKEKFHEALYDVQILQSLSSSFINKEAIFQYSKSFSDAVMHIIDLQTISNTLPYLGPLQSVLKDGMLRKIAKEKITYEILKKGFEENGEEGILQILTTPLKNGKPRVTKNKHILSQITNFFKTKRSDKML